MAKPKKPREKRQPGWVIIDLIEASRVPEDYDVPALLREAAHTINELQARLRDRIHELDEYRADAEAWQDYQYQMARGLRRPK